MHLPTIIIDLALILAVAGVVTLLFKKLKQPVVLGYIIAGILVGPNFSLFPSVYEREGIQIWADIGVIFLLFSLGLEFSFKKLARVGTSASVTAVVEVGVMLVLGYFTGKVLGWSTMDSVFLGGILSVSSTTIIIRAFDELGVKNRKYAGLVFGVLIIEDLVAIVLLVLLSTLALTQQFAGMEMAFSFLKLLFFLTLWFIAGIFLIPSFLKRAKKLLNNETLLVLSLGLCLLMVVLAVSVGFSAALGAFVMGSILAETTLSERIEKLTNPVKDLFAAVFFVSVGMLIDPKMLQEYAGPIAVITIVTIIGKMIGTTSGALISGQPLKQSIQSGMSLAQIGEFSFIIATLGVTLKVTSDFLYPIAVAVSAITTFTTPYLIRLADPFYQVIERKMPKGILDRIQNYSSGAQTITHESKWKLILRSYLTIVIINSVVILSVITLTSRYLVDFIFIRIESYYTSSIISCAVAFILMSPFLWALAVKKIAKHAYMNLWMKSTNRGPLVMLEISRVLLAVFFILFLIYQLFSERLTFVIMFGVAVVIIMIFSKALQKFYLKIETRFLKNLNSKQLEKDQNSAKSLIPWDAHFGEFKVDYESSMAGFTLEELQLREKLGVNIVCIERGNLRINIPKRNERLYPGDLISVAGTDTQLDDFRKMMEASMVRISDETHSEVSLQAYTITEKFPFLGLTIRESKFRETTNALILGIERSNERILNPGTEMRFQKGDNVWVVGNKEVLKKIFVKEK